MNAQIAPLYVFAGFMAFLLCKALWLKVQTYDIPCTYGLFAVRDALIRLVVENKIDRNDPHFVALYNNVNVILSSSRLISGPDGWPLAKATGSWSARNPAAKPTNMIKIPGGEFPKVLQPISEDAMAALAHISANHFGVHVFVSAKRSEARKLQKAQAKQFLESLKPVASLA